MRVLVDGATGFIGHGVARQPAEAGLRPRLAVRRPIRGALVALVTGIPAALDESVAVRLVHPVEDTKGW